MESPSPRRPQRQDTFDLRETIVSDEQSYLIQMQGEPYPSDEEHSMIEDDSDPDERDGDYADDDDRSSSLSIPNESIDFDLVYSLHSFAATVEGQASVVKGDSLVLMDDSNSYWWLVRVLKTQEIGYIPAENIETPFERLARLNKHRNVDLASATQAEMQDGLQESRDHFRNNMSSRAGSNRQTPSPTLGNDARGAARPGQLARRSVIFTPALQVHRYPPAVWGDDEEVDDDDEWDVGGYEDEDPSLAEEAALADQERRGSGGAGGDSDDGMSWEEPLPDGMGAQVVVTAEDLQNELQTQQVQQQEQQHLRQLQEAEQQAAQQLQLHQRQQIEEQRRQQQLIAQTMVRQGSATPTQGPGGISLRESDSREQLAPPQDTSVSVSSSSSSARSMDPIDASETKKLTMTPLLVQDNNQRSQSSRQAAPRSSGPLLPSEVMQRQEEERKRTREEIGALEEAARKKAKSPSGGRTNGPAKLRKEPQSGDEDSGKEKDKKGKSGGLFGRLFDRRKDKNKEKASNDSIDITRSVETRSSEESGRSSNHTDNSGGVQSPPRKVAAAVITPPPVSLHTTSLRQRDREQQALYQQQYLTRSPSSPPEAQPLLQMSPVSPQQGLVALGGASATLSPTSDGRRPRPGSLLIGGNISGDGSSSVPELSVIRIFAGKKLQTEATFKTVLLNSSTTSEELVKQAIQRFRLPAGEDATDYYLTVKRLEGSSAVLKPEEKPLGVFEMLAEAALDLPKVKRSSVGSISSIASNLSQHSAIKKLPMNDFTDDTAVKIYLNRRSESASDESMTAEESDTINAESVQADRENGGTRLRLHNLNTVGITVPPERFSSPSFRFALQLLIYPDDLPDDMVFDPLTEAIVFKHTLRDRPHVTPSSAPFRRKVFVFPKNITVAEVIELGLERFGIPDGVVDGGDEVEDKNTKRRSSLRVRYALNVVVDGKERELIPSGKVIDAYPRPPSYRPADRRLSDSKRRSFDSMQLLGSLEDITPEDPLFILRRAITYRTSSRHRLSAPLDEIALQQLHRHSISSSSATSEDGDTKRSMSKQELITAQRAVWRANQRAILSAQANSQRGVDLLLPNNAVLRSSRYDADDRPRYSYVEGGETYDISDIMEEEWDSSPSTNQGDLLEGVLHRGSARDGVDEKLNRILSKIKDGRTIQRTASSTPPSASTVDSVYSDVAQDEQIPTPVERSRSSTPVVAGNHKVDDILPRGQSPASERTVTPDIRKQRSVTPSSFSQGRLTPQQQSIQAPLAPHLRQTSIASVTTDTSGYRTAVGSPVVSSPIPAKAGPLRQRKPKLTLPKDDFGVSHMMAIIELAGLQDKLPPLEPMHPVDELLFGRRINVDELHPVIREIYAPTFRQLDEMDQMLDDLLKQALSP
ncbi:hypothetical protein F5148DRAFT_1007792 [Russula earlei]|uniref:Uncharacterized protein n=1 Tax=Russula earlei TaxID=71964 RepID=A0ACC0UMB3_9AGAM|nr:hypothetical protein F5148DRAFT_1007792 [Russula earlei]